MNLDYSLSCIQPRIACRGRTLGASGRRALRLAAIRGAGWRVADALRVGFAPGIRERGGHEGPFATYTVVARGSGGGNAGGAGCAAGGLRLAWARGCRRPCGQGGAQAGGARFPVGIGGARAGVRRVHRERYAQRAHVRHGLHCAALVRFCRPGRWRSARHQLVGARSGLAVRQHRRCHAGRVRHGHRHRACAGFRR